MKCSVRGVLDLGHHDAVEVLAGTGDHLDHVAQTPLCRDAVDPHDARLAAVVVRVQGVHHMAPGGLLLERRDGVLEVEEYLVGRKLCRL